MKQHYDGTTPVVTLLCKLCGQEFESYGLTMEKLKELAIECPCYLYCAECDSDWNSIVQNAIKGCESIIDSKLQAIQPKNHFTAQNVINLILTMNQRKLKVLRIKKNCRNCGKEFEGFNWKHEYCALCYAGILQKAIDSLNKHFIK